MALRYEVVPGEGLVARYADSIIWVGAPIDAAAWDALGAVLELGPGTDPSGADTAARLGELQRALDEHPSTVFAALIVDGDQAQGILRGPVTVCNATDVAPATGHDQFGVTVPFPMSEAVFVGFHQPLANRPQLAELLDLDAGVVPGGGAWVHPVAESRRHSGETGTAAVLEPEPQPQPGSQPEPVARPEPVEQPEPEPNPLGAASSTGWPEPGPTQSWTPDPEPAASETPATGQHPAQQQGLPPVDGSGAWAAPGGGGATAAPAMQSGFTPAADYQRVDLRDAPAAGRAQPLPPIDHEPQPAQQRPEPVSAGAIVFDDGSTFSLDRDYVVGRRPQKDPRVQSGAAEALTVVDPDSVLSSAHALISRQDERIMLRDLGSLNGTHVAPPAATDWTKLEPHQELPIVPGTRLLFGWTVATFTGPDEPR